jgi:hypothetical protein
MTIDQRQEIRIIVIKTRSTAICFAISGRSHTRKLRRAERRMLRKRIGAMQSSQVHLLSESV